MSNAKNDVENLNDDGIQIVAVDQGNNRLGQRHSQTTSQNILFPKYFRSNANGWNGEGGGGRELVALSLMIIYSAWKIVKSPENTKIVGCRTILKSD